MNWVIKQILHRHLMQLLCHHLLWLSNQLSLPLITSILFLVLVLVPSTSETVAASTSAFVGWSSTTNLLYLMASHKTCCTCLQATKLAVSICSLATWYWAEGGRLTPPSMKSIYTPLVTIFTIFQPYSRFNKETCLL
ncbi:uncharacterized protein LOC124807774 isoform X22 [Hydra vulgaris]|uniref:uncharacterized protein LOC124807774 isoform X22 n=1 Tax=Hydra vulgaris TaxID=6087 RepID=UPI0032EA1FFB